MNNKQEFFNNDVEVNVSEEDIILAPPTELYDEAKEIAQNTIVDEVCNNTPIKKLGFMKMYN